MINMSAKFEEVNNSIVFILFTSLFPYMTIVTLTFDLRPPKSIGPFPHYTVANLSAKFNEEAHKAQRFSLFHVH